MKTSVAKQAIAVISDPRIFNFLIMGLYFLNALRWAVARRPWDSVYWLAALLLVLVVTFGYKH